MSDSRDPLPCGHKLTTNGGTSYVIDSVIDKGGFGVTYLAKKAKASARNNGAGATLWLDVGTSVAIKEFYPQQFGLRTDGGIIANPEIDDADEPFSVALERFRREAERLHSLTCLRAVRGALKAEADEGDGKRLRAEIIRSFGAKLGDPVTGNTAAACKLIDRLQGEMAVCAREAIHTAQLPVVYDGFEIMGKGSSSISACYFVMEYLDGGTLKDKIRAQRASRPPTQLAHGDMVYKVTKPWQPDAVRRFALAMSMALDELHHGIPGQQLIHCDLKPGNVMFRASSPDEPVLIDFGLARNTVGDASKSLMAATAGYAPIEIDLQGRPSQGSSGRRVGPWTDAYMLGVILRLLATGMVEQNKIPTAYARQQGLMYDKYDPFFGLPPFPSDYPPDLVAAIEHLLKLEIADRPQSMAQWQKRLTDPTQYPPDDPEKKSDKDVVEVQHQVVSLGNGVKKWPNKNHFIAFVSLLLVLGFLFVIYRVMINYADVRELPTKAEMQGASEPDEVLPANGMPTTDDNRDREVEEAAGPSGIQLPSGQSVNPKDSATPMEIAAPNLPSPQAVPVVSPAPSSISLSYTTLGISVRTVTDNGKLAALRMQGTPPNGAVMITGVSASNSRVREGEVLVSSCSGASAISALSSADAGRPACLLTESEKQIQFN